MESGKRYISRIRQVGCFKLMILLFPFILADPALAAGQELLYHLISDRRNADLDYALLQQLQARERRVTEELIADKTPTVCYVDGRDLEPLFFKPVVGRFRVLTFCALRQCQHIEPVDGQTDLIGHCWLVLKVDKSERIVDGFWFMREWAEPPMLNLLLRFHSKNHRLDKRLLLSPSDFKRLSGGYPKYFDPTGRLDNLINSREAF